VRETATSSASQTPLTTASTADEERGLKEDTGKVFIKIIWMTEAPSEESWRTWTSSRRARSNKSNRSMVEIFVDAAQVPGK
jgi:hypothetical protein